MKLPEALTAAIAAIDNARMAILVAGHPDDKLLEVLTDAVISLEAALEALEES